MKVSPQGIEFIKYLQSQKYEVGAYWRLTHISIYEETINNAITVELKQHQFDSLVSVCMSVKPSQFVKKRLIKYINEKLHPQFIQDEFRKLNKPFRRERINWDIVWRRKKELEYYFGKTVGYEDLKKKKRKK